MVLVDTGLNFLVILNNWPVVRIENYTVREVLMKNCMCVWQNISVTKIDYRMTLKDIGNENFYRVI